MTVINIRGTSGSGKSTLVVRLRQLYPIQDPVIDTVKDRAQTCGYVMRPTTSEGARETLVVGRYNERSGGCDTLPNLDVTYGLIRKWTEMKRHAVFEGIMASEEVTRAVVLSKGYRLVVIHLTTSLDDCLASIRARRLERGNDKTLNPANTTNRYKVVSRACDRLRAAGVEVVRLDREAAYNYARELLGV